METSDLFSQEAAGSSDPNEAVVSNALADGEAGAADDAVPAEILQRMCFRVGELGLLFPFDVGREVTAPPPVSRVPNTAPWFRGLANVRGAVVPVIDTAAAFGVARDANMPVYMLILGHGETAIGLLIDGLPRLLDVDVAGRLPDNPGVSPLLDPSVVAAYDRAGRTWLDFDVDALFDALARHVGPGYGEHH